MAITNNVGSLKIQITNNNFFPVEGASVYISPTGMPDSTSEEFVTDENGIVIDEELPAPDVAYSLEPGDNQPYSEYNVLVNAYGYNERFISGVQIFSGENGIQNIELTPSDGSNTNPTVLDAHTLWEQYPPKIAEDMIKPVNPSGGIVLSRVVVPETIVVHDGAPTDSTARDYYVPYKDYIKNVACNEIPGLMQPSAQMYWRYSHLPLIGSIPSGTGEKDTTLLSRAIPRLTRSGSTMQPYLKMSPRSSMRCSPTISQNQTLHSLSLPSTATAGVYHVRAG